MSLGGAPSRTVSTSVADEGDHGIPVSSALFQMVRKGRSWSGRERHCCFLNLGQGKFANVSSVSGFDFPDDGRSVALCDWDFDGDLDLWTANRTGPQVRFLRNDLETSNHFVTIRLEGKTCNRDAIGARVEVTLQSPEAEGEDSTLVKTLRAGEGFMAQSSKRMHFGLGAAEEIKQVTVRWPGGERETFKGLQTDRHYHLIENSGNAQEWTPPKSTGSLTPSNSPYQKSTEQARIVSAVPLPLPRLDYESDEGQTRWIDEASQGGPVLLNLWASWCRPCLKEIREIAERESEIREAGITVFALSVDRLESSKTDGPNSTSELLSSFGYRGNSGWATEGLADKLLLVDQHLFDFHQPLSVPTSLLIDSSGRLAVFYRGPVTVDQVLADAAQLPNIADSPTALPFEGRWRIHRKPLTPLDIAWRLVDQGYVNDSAEYITRNRAQLRNSAHIHRLYLRVGNHLLKRGDVEKAISYYRDAMKLKENYVDAQNNLAWVLSTHPNKQFRNGKEAIRLISMAVKTRPESAFGLLDTLAAAYAEDKQFEKAVATAKRAFTFATEAGHHQYASEIQGRLVLYQSGKPYRE